MLDTVILLNALATAVIVYAGGTAIASESEGSVQVKLKPNQEVSLIVIPGRSCVPVEGVNAFICEKKAEEAAPIAAEAQALETPEAAATPPQLRDDQERTDHEEAGRNCKKVAFFFVCDKLKPGATPVPMCDRAGASGQILQYKCDEPPALEDLICEAGKDAILWDSRVYKLNAVAKFSGFIDAERAHSFGQALYEANQKRDELVAEFKNQTHRDFSDSDLKNCSTEDIDEQLRENFGPKKYEQLTKPTPAKKAAKPKHKK